MFEKLIAERDNEIHRYKTTATQEVDLLSQRHQPELNEWHTGREGERAILQTKAYSNDLRSNHPIARSAVKPINHILKSLGFVEPLEPVSFIAIVCTLLAVTIECLIFLSFSSVVKSLCPHEFILVEHEFEKAQKKTTQSGLNPKIISES
ncbi:MAG: hypothetical protein ACRERS_02910 [Methylococcales bacterium]